MTEIRIAPPCGRTWSPDNPQPPTLEVPTLSGVYGTMNDEAHQEMVAWSEETGEVAMEAHGYTKRVILTRRVTQLEGRDGGFCLETLWLLSEPVQLPRG